MAFCFYRNGGADPEDLWDFGTVRHAATVGRAAPNPVQVSGPPLTWENNGTTRSDGSSNSGGSSYSGSGRRGPSDSSVATTVTVKGELPPIPSQAQGPPTPTKRAGSYDRQATIRHGNSSTSNLNNSNNSSNNSGLAREPSDEDEYDSTYGHSSHRADLDDELPDTTMLDSVVLPAIASVSSIRQFV